ncbi:DUF202 domain-containing protein [Plantactinospora sp. B5E13]|uniref:DUF202 domain-containing protein n=1 Tax=Plantactinospora sp. B5E13 TaxID=3153758 RepID=UPI00325F5E8B
MTGAPDAPRAPASSRDAGLARERTRLAWRRTTLSVTVVAVLAGRLALTRGTVGAVAAALAGLGWLAVLVWTVPRYGGRTPGAGRTLPLIALVVAGFAILGVLLVLTPVR